MRSLKQKIWTGIFIVILLTSCSERRKITIIETTDLHGVIFPFDFIENETLEASLANSATYVKEKRNKNEPVILLDNGDNLQGQPVMYYYNFIDTLSTHFSAEVMNYLEYDAGTVGNHDIEAGHPVYDRLIEEYKFPLLAANAIDRQTGKPYFKPYTVIEKKGIKVAVLGLVTPSIPEWLPPEFYSGIEFKGMVETAKYWMPVILKEKPDIVVGLFHSGWNKDEFESRRDEFLNEDGSAAVAFNVPGFDIIFNGHDHKIANEKFINSEGDTVLMLNGGSKSQYLATAEITFVSKRKNNDRKKIIKGNLIKVADYEANPDFLAKFETQKEIIHDYVNKVIGTASETLSSRDSYFGPSPFIDMIHKVQLDITGADISFTAPLSFDVKIQAGPVTVSDMFKLYRFENMLYTISLSGREVLDYLEYSYSGWFNTMSGPDDVLLKLRMRKDGKPVLQDGKAWLVNQPYNFDSAAGIDYTVDVSRKPGDRITIKGFSDGKKFDEKAIYRIAVNSYRGSGGGGHLTEGAGLNRDELQTRLISSTGKDLRYYILRYIENKKTIEPDSYNNWTIIPENWVNDAVFREYKLLFGSEKASSEN